MSLDEKMSRYNYPSIFSAQNRGHCVYYPSKFLQIARPILDPFAVKFLDVEIFSFVSKRSAIQTGTSVGTKNERAKVNYKIRNFGNITWDIFNN